ncbi:MAG TPA: hypothetical protein VMI53_00705 [Opitutaceae bacterium]|nr:hypothetical protein [Opitutaceae bacterium]
MAPAGDELPRVLIFSEGVLSRSHGTGTIFARNFSAYPRDRLANWFIGGSEDPLFPDALNLGPQRWPRSLLSPPATLPAKIWNRCGLRPFWTVPVNLSALREAARIQPFAPDLVYAIIISREGMDSLRGILDGLPQRVRAVLQIQDFFPTSALGFMRALHRLAPRVAEVWGVSRPILAAVAPHLPGIPRRFDPLCYLELPPESKTEHRPYGAGFRTVVIGNFWNPALLADVRAVWRKLQQRLPGLPPVRWHCHPAGVARVRAAGYEPGAEVEPAPFLSGEALFAELRAADLALIPFSREDQPASDYERFSMPSRLTELCPCGLPIFCLSGRDTPIHAYLTEHDIGRCAPAGEAGRAAAALEELVRDAPARARLGARARLHAERHFQLRPFQTWLAEKFRTLAAAKN